MIINTTQTEEAIKDKQLLLLTQILVISNTCKEQITCMQKFCAKRERERGYCWSNKVQKYVEREFYLLLIHHEPRDDIFF